MKGRSLWAENELSSFLNPISSVYGIFFGLVFVLRIYIHSFIKGIDVLIRSPIRPRPKKIKPVETNETEATSGTCSQSKAYLLFQQRETSKKKQNGKRAKNLKWSEIHSGFENQREKGKSVVNGSNRTFSPGVSCNLWMIDYI